MPISTPPKTQMKRNIENLQRKTLQDARKRLIATAADARKAIQRSLKSGGKNRYSKTYQTSKPGEPPKTHGGRLKRSIRYEIESDKKIKVGAPSLSGSKTAKTLEEGGVGTLTERTLKASYFARRKARARAQKGQAQTPPPTKRAYTMRSETGQTRRVKEYERFKSASTAKRGAESSGFKSWRATVEQTTTQRLPIQPRPYVFPGVRISLTTQKRVGGV